MVNKHTTWTVAKSEMDAQQFGSSTDAYLEALAKRYEARADRLSRISQVLFYLEAAVNIRALKDSQ